MPLTINGSENFNIHEYVAFLFELNYEKKLLPSCRSAEFFEIRDKTCAFMRNFFASGQVLEGCESQSFYLLPKAMELIASNFSKLTSVNKKNIILGFDVLVLTQTVLLSKLSVAEYTLIFNHGLQRSNLNVLRYILSGEQALTSFQGLQEAVVDSLRRACVLHVILELAKENLGSDIMQREIKDSAAIQAYSQIFQDKLIACRDLKAALAAYQELKSTSCDPTVSELPKDWREDLIQDILPQILERGIEWQERELSSSARRGPSLTGLYDVATPAQASMYPAARAASSGVRLESDSQLV